jgi:hypothetical protein
MTNPAGGGGAHREATVRAGTSTPSISAAATKTEPRDRCEKCGGLFSSRDGFISYCDHCRAAGAVPLFRDKSCVGCGRLYVPRGSRQKFCAECIVKFKQDRLRDRVAQHRARKRGLDPVTVSPEGGSPERPDGYSVSAGQRGDEPGHIEAAGRRPGPPAVNCNSMTGAASRAAIREFFAYWDGAR